VLWNAPDASRRYVEAVRKERNGLGVLLEDVDRWEILEDRIRAHCEEGSFVYQKLRQPEVQALLSRLAGEVFSGTPVFQVLPVREPQRARAASVPEAEAPEATAGDEDAEAGAAPGTEVRSDPAVQETLELFRGEITEVKPPEGGSGGQ